MVCIHLPKSPIWKRIAKSKWTAQGHFIFISFTIPSKWSADHDFLPFWAVSNEQTAIIVWQSIAVTANAKVPSTSRSNRKSTLACKKRPENCHLIRFVAKQWWPNVWARCQRGKANCWSPRTPVTICFILPRFRFALLKSETIGCDKWFTYFHFRNWVHLVPAIRCAINWKSIPISLIPNRNHRNQFHSKRWRRSSRKSVTNGESHRFVTSC